jgi:Sulfotransferase family
VKTYHLFVGLPRTGGTVLASILNQNPEVYVASDTAMFEVLRAMRKEWKITPTMIANPIPEQLNNITNAVLDSMWSHKKESIIIDRNREWGGEDIFAKEVFKKDMKYISTVRDLPSIMASWKILYLNECNNVEYANHMTMAVYDRFVKNCIEKLKKLLIEAKDRTLIIDYDSFVKYPDDHLKKIEKFLELPEHVYDLNNIEGQYQDRNIVPFGPKNLHRIRSELSKQEYSPEEVLGKEQFNYFKNLSSEYL